jgi:hypothetical protein
MKNAPLIRFPLWFGLLAGGLCFGYFLVLYAAQAQPLGSRRNLGLVLIWLCMALAVRAWVRRAQRPITFLEAFGVCVATVLVASLVDGLLMVGFVRYADPAMLPRFIAEIKQQALSDRAALQRNFGKHDSGQLIDFDEFIRQVERIDLRSIFWANFSVARLVLSLLYSALIAVFFRRMSQSR